MATYHLSNSQRTAGRQPKPGKIHRLYTAGGFYVAKRPAFGKLDQPTMAEQAKDGALVFHEIFCNVTGGVPLRINFGNINNRRAGVCFPPIFQKRMGDVRAPAGDMDVRLAMLCQLPNQDVLEIGKVLSDFFQKANPASFHQSDSLSRRRRSGRVRGQSYHALWIA